MVPSCQIMLGNIYRMKPDVNGWQSLMTLAPYRKKPHNQRKSGVKRHIPTEGKGITPHIRKRGENALVGGATADNTASRAYATTSVAIKSGGVYQWIF